jgi:outer membrane protein assembly factor BamB
MKKLTLSLFVSISILFAISVQAQVGQDQARNFQINETHTGSSSSPGLVPPLKPKWSVNFGQNISYPIIADGKVFVTVRNASVYGTKVYALNAVDGSTLWSFDLEGVYYWSALCYENGRLFALNYSGLLRAFDGATGAVIWSRQLPGQYSFSSAPTVYQGVIYTGGAGSGGTAYAVSADTGVVLWTKSVANGDNSSPAVTDDGVYVSYSCPNVYKLNPVNGAQIWRYSTGCSGGGGKTPALYNGRLYVRDYNPDYIFDSQTGGVAGSFLSKSVPAFSGNRGFFLNGPKGFGSYGVLEGRDANTNMLNWSFSGDGSLQSAVLVVNDYVYVGSNSGKLYAVEAATGSQVWSTTAGTSIPYVDEQNVSQPLTGFAAGEGILVVPTTTKLVAYEADHSPTITWDSPTPAANSFGWNNTPVQLSFTAVPHVAGSGFMFSAPGSPLQFNSEGSNQTQQVTVSDWAGNSAIITSPAVNIDWTPPVTSATLSGTVAPGISAVYSTPVQVTLTAADTLSGVRTRFYTLDGGPTQTYSTPFTISTDGNHTLNYWTVDTAGNSESQKTRFIDIDVSAPATEIAVSGISNNGWYADPVQVSLTATDTMSSVTNTSYTVDGGSVQTFANPFTVSGEGNHVVSYWSVDSVGHAETHRSLTIKIDSSAPTTLLAKTGTAGNDGWYRGPVQVSLSATDTRSGVAASYYTVDGGAAQPYTGPFTISANAEHQINFWSVDKVGNTESQQPASIKIDSVGPVTQNAVSGQHGSNGYFTGPVQWTLTATDNLSGVANIYYKVDDGPTQTYADPFTVSGDGTHPVNYWSVDVAGNSSSVGTVYIRIDATMPVTVAALSGPPGASGWYSTPVTITLSATETGSGLVSSYYTLDWGQPITYTGPFTISTSGVHRVFYWSADLAGNYEPLQYMDIKVDMTAPSTQANMGGVTTDSGWWRNAPEVRFTVTDGESGTVNTYYTIDEGATQTYTTAFNVSGGGTHVVKYWSVDAVGNTETQQSLTVKVDVTAPTTQISTGGIGGNGWYRSSVQVSLTGDDNGEAGVNHTFYSVDGGPTQTYAGVFPVSGEGQHQVSFWSTDWFGNTEAPKNAVVKIDLTAPATQSSLNGPVGGNGYYKGAVQVSLTASDNLSGVAAKYFRIDGGATQTYTNAFAVSGDGNHTVDYWSVDGAGNVAGAATVIVKIDTSAPLTQTSVSGTTGTNGWYTTNTVVSLSASDPLSGVQTTYYKIDGGSTRTYTAAFNVQGNGPHTLNYWSVDKATNTETMGSLAINIDANLPSVTANVNPASANKSSTPVTITVSGHATDTISGVALTGGATFSVLDEYGVAQPSGPVTLQSNGNYSFTLTLPATKNVGDNSHLYTITVRGTDRAGNTNTASDTLKIN